MAQLQAAKDLSGRSLELSLQLASAEAWVTGPPEADALVITAEPVAATGGPATEGGGGGDEAAAST